MNWVKTVRCFTSFTKPNGKIFEISTLQSLIMNKFQEGTVHAQGIISLRVQQERGCIASNPFQRADFGSKDIYTTTLSARNMFQHAKLPCCLEGNVLGPKKYSMTISRQFGQSTQDGPKLDRDFLVQLWAADKKIQPWTADKKIQPRAADKKMKKLREKKDQAAAAPLLARSNLLITRDIEWANLVFGFEQENRYVIVDVCDPLTPAGYIYEKSNVIARQLLRLRRPFVAYITDAMGNEVFRVRRPFWLITSSIYVEIDGKEVGVVHRRWHLWRRVYDLYLGKKQFAEVENPGFWNWTFTLKDIDGQVLAQIDRDWRGFGFELFTDAGQYVIRFGSTDSSSITVPAGVIKELEVICPLTLPERAVVVALAISLDNDYFSRHGRWGIPFIPVEE